jgi:Ca2+-binding RTX toxin-like protein
VAKPWWGSFFTRYDISGLERLWESLSDERLAARHSHLVQLTATPAAAVAESASDAEAAPAVVFALGTADRTAFDGATPAGDALSGDAPAITGTVAFGGGPNLVMIGLNTLFAEAAANYAVFYSDDLQSGLVVNLLNNTLLEGGPGNFPELGEGPNDILTLSGDFSSGIALPGQPDGLDSVVLAAGNDYNLVAGNDRVAPGEILTIDAMPLGNDGRIIFDGSAETDGAYQFLGSGEGDTFIGGAGADRIVGNGGGDTLNGGGGGDTFVYTGARESSGPDYDTLAGFTAGTDHIDLPGTISGFAAPIGSGALSTASFDADLGAALAGLGASQAVWFAPDSGDLAGTVFLVADANGIAGYQPGEDYVFAIAGTPLADLTGHTDIFV